MKKANYVRILNDTGEIFDVVGSYDAPEDRYVNAPELLPTDDQNAIIAIMKKNGIKKLDVIL